MTIKAMIISMLNMHTPEAKTTYPMTQKPTKTIQASKAMSVERMRDFMTTLEPPIMEEVLPKNLLQSKNSDELK